MSTQARSCILPDPARSRKFRMWLRRHIHLVNVVDRLAQRLALAFVPRAHWDDSNLSASLTTSSLQAFLLQQFSSNEWAIIEEAVRALDIPLKSGGSIWPSDRRAVYHIARYNLAVRALEIGTHIGVSAVHIALALRTNATVRADSDYHLTTVDIRDVNNQSSKPWLAFGTSLSPMEMFATLGMKSHVTFVNSDSMEYMRRSGERFDFIFLDGSHRATAVYREIPAAIRLLRKGGLVVIHDYFPHLQPLRPGGLVIPGPWMAVQRLLREGAHIHPIPLGLLPWDQGLDASPTSLALLTADMRRVSKLAA